MAISKPPILALFTNTGNQSSQSVNWKVDAVFHPNDQLVDVLTCNKVTADGQGGVNIPSVNGMPQVLMPAASLKQGGAVCPSVATGTGSPGSGSTGNKPKSAGLPGVRVTWAVFFASMLFFVMGRSRWI